MKHRGSIWLLILVAAVVLTACSSNEPESTTAAPVEETTVAVETTAAEETTVAEETTAGDEALPVFTAETLAKYNGKDGNAAYVAYEGKVYDVTNIEAWKNGIHQGRFEAGKDYTDVLNNQAPHSSDNLTKNAPIVGLFE